MIYFQKSLFRLSAFMIFLAAFSACSDDPASPGSGAEEEEQPLVPDITTVMNHIDLSFFESEDDVPYDEDHTAYFTAASYAGATNIFLAMTSMHTTFLGLTEGKDPEYVDGMWVWEYSYSESSFSKALAEHGVRAKAGDSFTMRVVAKPVSGGMEWSLYLSGVFGEEMLDEYLMLDGYISNDESEGNWRFFSPETGNLPVMTAEWSIESETVHEYTLNFYEEEGPVETFEFIRDGAESWLAISGGIGLYWNEDTGLGWVTEDGVKTCFDASNQYRNTTCPA